MREGWGGGEKRRPFWILLPLYASPVIPAKAGIQGVVGLTAVISRRADERPPRFVDNHDGRVVAHWIPAFAGMTVISHSESMPSDAAKMKRACLLTTR